MRNTLSVWITLSFLLCIDKGRSQASLPGTKPLVTTENLSVRMVLGVDRFLDEQLAAAVENRTRFWSPDFSTPKAYEKSVESNRSRFIRMIGAVDRRVPRTDMELVSTVDTPAKVAETDRFVAYAVRWAVLDGVYGEGLLLRPKIPVLARVIAVPDADQLPEMIAGLRRGLTPELQYARRLAENGCEVVIPTLIDRSARFSRNERIGAETNQPHREFIYRQAYILGRHVIGYEVQKLRSAVDWLTGRNEGGVPIGLVGWGEGALIAFYTAAVDTRVDTTLVSGYFGKRERLWEEPLYRNVFGLLSEFGDAEIARLIVPRQLLIEPAMAPVLPKASSSIPVPDPAAAGRLAPIPIEEIRWETKRAASLAGPFKASIRLLDPDSRGPIADRTLVQFFQSLVGKGATLEGPGAPPVELGRDFDESERQGRQVRQMERHIQRLIPLSADDRNEFLWKKVSLSTPEAWREAMRPYRETFWTEAIGKFSRSTMSLNPRSRLIQDKPTWATHEITLDVFPQVEAWGYYFLPKGIAPGERRPVVVVQHGGGGMPADAMNEDPKSSAFRLYNAYAVKLAERGFIVFAPHLLNGGHDRLPNRPSTRLLQRKANPIGKTLTSIGIAQHEAILDWLAAQPEVDAARIGFYGLSYGGKAAMRIPAVLDCYALAICSGDFNEWIWKSATTDYWNSNVFKAHFDVLEFNLGPTFNYAEMAALIAPRPFMVERGHDDGVGLDEWVAFEYAKVNRLYAKLKIPELTEIDYFDGPHTIHGVGTFRFLHRHLEWPEPKTVPHSHADK